MNGNHYSDEELKEFKKIIQEKLKRAIETLNDLRDSGRNPNGDSDTAPTFKCLSEGRNACQLEEVERLCARQAKYVQDLKSALFRTENKTYGICRVTGKLIPKQRLKIVPHATTSLEGKKMLEERENKIPSRFLQARG